MWLETAEFNNPRTALISYAVPNSNNEWFMVLQTRQSIKVIFDLDYDIFSISDVGAGVQKVCLSKILTLVQKY